MQQRLNQSEYMASVRSPQSTENFLNTMWSLDPWVNSNCWFFLFCIWSMEKAMIQRAIKKHICSKGRNNRWIYFVISAGIKILRHLYWSSHFNRNPLQENQWISQPIFEAPFKETIMSKIFTPFLASKFGHLNSIYATKNYHQAHKMKIKKRKNWIKS